MSAADTDIRSSKRDIERGLLIAAGVTRRALASAEYTGEIERAEVRRIGRRIAKALVDLECLGGLIDDLVVKVDADAADARHGGAAMDHLGASAPKPAKPTTGGLSPAEETLDEIRAALHALVDKLAQDDEIENAEMLAVLGQVHFAREQVTELVECYEALGGDKARHGGAPCEAGEAAS